MLRVVSVLFFVFVSCVFAEKTGGFSISDTGIVLSDYRYLSKLNLSPDTNGKVTFDNKGKKSTWELYVPKNYNPKYPPGVFVFLHSDDDGTIPDDLKPVMEKYNLIWVSANNVGSEYPNSWREASTITGLKKVREMYTVDDKRTYISGCTELSGWMSVFRSDLFYGAVQIDQVTLWRPHTSDAKIQAASKNYFVFITGTQNLNQKTTKKTLREFKSYKFKNVKFMKIPGDVFGIAPADKMDEAIAHVDSIAAKKTSDLLRKADWAEKYKQYEKALNLYREIGSYSGVALGKVIALENQIVTYMKEAEKATSTKDYLKAYEIYTMLSTRYGSEAEEAAIKLKSFKENKTISNEIRALDLFQKIKVASKKNIENKKIMDALLKLIEKYPGTEAAKKAADFRIE